MLKTDRFHHEPSHAIPFTLIETIDGRRAHEHRSLFGKLHQESPIDILLQAIDRVLCSFAVNVLWAMTGGASASTAIANQDNNAFIREFLEIQAMLQL